MQISTIADTWIHLTKISQAGERNRALSIVKSRGMKHSNQVRELILSDQGIALADVYTAGGDVLMGTARWQKEAAEQAEQERIRAEVEHKRREVALARVELGARLYVVDKGPSSARAIANLSAICEKHLPDNHQIEIVDLLQDPRRVLSDTILATPTLIKLSPTPVRKISPLWPSDSSWKSSTYSWSLPLRP